MKGKKPRKYDVSRKLFRQLTDVQPQMQTSRMISVTVVEVVKTTLHSSSNINWQVPFESRGQSVMLFGVKLYSSVIRLAAHIYQAPCRSRA